MHDLRSLRTKVAHLTAVRLTWDAFELVVDPAPVRVVRSRIAPVRADLSWLGFPERVDNGPMSSERFDYERLRPADQAPWNQAPGKMTRYGDVRPLLTDVDDRFVIFGAGDQLQLDYALSDLPPLPEGWRRDWLVRLDGYGHRRYQAEWNTRPGRVLVPRLADAAAAHSAAEGR